MKMKSRENIRKELNAQLEEPRLVVKEVYHERSEHFGQVQVTVFGEVEVENKGPYHLLMEIGPNDLRTALEEFFETTMYIRDPDLNFSTEVSPKILGMRFGYDRYAKVYVLNIEYEWEEV